MGAASNRTAHLALILGCALTLSWPLISRGVTGGYDASTHARYQHHFSQQFWEGEPYPRWLAQENKGYGSPIFLIQYPFPYFATALIRPFALFPAAEEREARELGLFIALALAAAGAATRHWLRQFLPAQAATAGALCYLLLPEMIMSAYLRTAIGELSALIFMPLCLAFCEKLPSQRAALFPLAACFALLITSNPLIALPFALLIPVYTVSCSRESGRDSGRGPGTTALRAALALVVGGGLAAVYLLPLYAYRGLFDLGALARHLPDFQPAKHFLRLDHGVLNRRLFPAFACAVALAPAAGWLIWRGRTSRAGKLVVSGALLLGGATLIPDLGQRIVLASGLPDTPTPYHDSTAVLLLGFSATFSLAVLAYALPRAAGSLREKTLILIGVLCFLAMLPFAAWLWWLVPPLQDLQFPGRFGSILSVAAAGLFAAAVGRAQAGGRRLPIIALACALTATAAGGMLGCRLDDLLRAPAKTLSYRAAHDVDLMYRTYVPQPQLAAFAGSMGTAPGTYGCASRPGEGGFRAGFAAGEGSLDVIRNSPRSLLISADCGTQALLEISQLYFPLWRRLPLSGSRDTRLGPSTTGLLQVSLPPGRQQFALVFDGGGWERAGLAVSIASLAVWLLGYLLATLSAMVKTS